MAFDFPNAPTIGQTYPSPPVAGQPVYAWDGEKWVGATAGPATQLPLMDGIAAVGISVKYGREDHVHPSDTTKAPVNSPAFTGTPRSPTPALADNSDMIATTAFVKSHVPTGFLPLSGGSMTGQLSLAPSGAIGTQGPAGQINVQSNGGADACMVFVRNGYFGCNFGLSSDNNFYYGGWSFGAGAYRFWTTRDFSSPNANAVSDMRWVIAGDQSVGYNSVWTDGWSGSALCGLYGTYTGAWLISTARWRYLQILIPNRGWLTLAYQ